MIVVKLYGGIGNQMFQYAAAKKLARLNNSEFKLDISHYDLHSLPNNLPYRSFDLSIFNLPISLASEKEISKFKNIPQNIFKRLIKKIKNYFNPYIYFHEPYFHFCPDFYNLKGNIYIEGYWQSEKYFIDIEDEIRNDFQIKTDLSKEAIYIKSLIDQSNSVCLNVRRQEFVTNPFVDQFVGIDYITNGINLIKKQISNPHFFIFSDDLAWCKDNLNINGTHTFVDDRLYGDKFRNCLYLMTQCKHFVIPNSTFGWWAAWLAPFEGKVVVAPNEWLKNSNKITKDVFPESWIRI